MKGLESYGGTNIYSALKLAMEIVAMNENPKTHQPMIVFLTDGEPTVGIVNTRKIISKVGLLVCALGLNCDNKLTDYSFKL